MANDPVMLTILGRVLLLAALFICISLDFSSSRAGHNQAPLSLGRDDGVDAGVALWGKMLVLRDPTRSLTVEDVSGPDWSGHFIPLTGDLNFGFTSDVVWLRFDLLRSEAAPRDWLLEATPAMLDDIRIFSTRSGGGYTEQKAGDTLPFAERAIPSRNFVFRISLPDDDVQRFFVRLDTTSSMVARFELWQPEGLIDEAAKDMLIFGALLGMAVFVVFFNIVLYSWLREPIYLYYLGYVICFTTVMALSTGLVSRFVPGSFGFVNPALTVALCLTYGAVAKLTSAALELRGIPRLNTFVGILALCYFAAALVLPVMNWRPAGLVLQWCLFAMIALFLCCLVMAWKRNVGAGIYALAFTPQLLASSALYLRNFGLLPVEAINEYGVMAGAMAHLLLLNAALASRIWRSEAERRRAQRLALQESRRAEQELENKVAERTSELSSLNERLKREIEERTALQVELQAALATERRSVDIQRQFVSLVSHEFRTPLSVIDTVAQRFSQTTSLTPSSIQAGAMKIRRSVERLLNLANNCLADERLAKRSLRVVKKQVDLVALAEEVVASRRHAEIDRIRIVSGAGPLLADCDPGLLGIILGNLLDNAVKYSKPGTDIEIRLEAERGHAVLSVQNEGALIGPADAEHIFDRFYRAKNATGKPGTGLGLYIAREIARRHGGDLVLIQEDTTGPVFRLTLPENFLRFFAGTEQHA